MLILGFSGGRVTPDPAFPIVMEVPVPRSRFSFFSAAFSGFQLVVCTRDGRVRPQDDNSFETNYKFSSSNFGPLM